MPAGQIHALTGGRYIRQRDVAKRPHVTGFDARPLRAKRVGSRYAGCGCARRYAIEVPV